MMYGETLLVPMKEKIFNKSSKENNKKGTFSDVLTTYILR